jgi:hypothetical protein
MSAPDSTPLTPIPSELHSEYEERPFQNCTRCGESLADFPGGFQVSKAFKQGECVMEYALCDHCRSALMQEFSIESKRRLAEFQSEAVTLDRGLDACAVCGCPKDHESMRDFVLTGLCEGDRLHHGLLMCGTCGDQVQDLISVATRDTWRRFVDSNFPGPPPGDSLPLPEKIPLSAGGSLA